MNRPCEQQLWLAAGCLASIILALRYTDGLAGTEFSGGWLTGPLLSMTDIGTVLFGLALIGAFFTLRVAGVIGILSSLLCLPLYLYFIAPVPFAAIFARGHEFKVHQSPGIHWDGWALAGVLILAITVYFCLRGFAKSSHGNVPSKNRNALNRFKASC